MGAKDTHRVIVGEGAMVSEAGRSMGLSVHLSKFSGVWAIEGGRKHPKHGKRLLSGFHRIGGHLEG